MRFLIHTLRHPRPKLGGALLSALLLATAPACNAVDDTGGGGAFFDPAGDATAKAADAGAGRTSRPGFVGRTSQEDAGRGSTPATRDAFDRSTPPDASRPWPPGADSGGGNEQSTDPDPGPPAVDTSGIPPGLDSDEDGLDDITEIQLRLDPRNPDTDGDDIPDGIEVNAGLDARSADSDGDGILDGGEVRVGTDPLSPDRACAEAHYEAGRTTRSVDVVLIIDNSGSMTQEIEAVQRNINVNFAAILDAASLDYRVILISRHGSASDHRRVCISQPLSGTDCSPIPDQPANTERFRHYSVTVNSHDSFQKALSAWDRKDEHGLAPNGWSEWVREDALKVFIVITDDESNMDPEDIDKQLLALEPKVFGTEQDRDYIAHSIIGLDENEPPTAPWLEDQPIVNGKCSPGSQHAGVRYQRLSLMTGGLRFPICHHESFDAVFDSLADDVVTEARLRCTVKAPPAGEDLVADLERTVLQYRAGRSDEVRQITHISSEEECAADNFYVADETIKLCPDICAEAESDLGAEMSVYSDCRTACIRPAPEDCEDRVDNDCDGLLDYADPDCDTHEETEDPPDDDDTGEGD